MKKSLVFSLISSSLLISPNSLKADWDYYGIDYLRRDGGVHIYTINSATGDETLRINKCIIYHAEDGCHDLTPSFNPQDQKLYFKEQADLGVRYHSYDLKTNTWEEDVSDWDGWKDEWDTVIERENPIRRDGDTISIGDNSLKLKETATEQQLWGTNADGEIVPINITNGSKLLINGRDVEQSINNVGALSAALTGLPTVPTSTNLACGFGTGTHGGDFAFSGGCASKINEKLSVNYAASMTMPGQDYAGNFEDKFSARAGFVWHLGEANKQTQISLKQKKGIDLKISKLENDNELLKSDIELFKAENKELKTKNNEIISQNEKLLARLERLENIAFKLHKNDELKLSQGL